MRALIRVPPSKELDPGGMPEAVPAINKRQINA
jgi:hypothetical protein